jgi:hypothetical protein
MVEPDRDRIRISLKDPFVCTSNGILSSRVHSQIIYIVKQPVCEGGRRALGSFDASLLLGEGRETVRREAETEFNPGLVVRISEVLPRAAPRSNKKPGQWRPGCSDWFGATSFTA